MALDTRILLGAQGVQAPDPLEGAQRGMQLAALARAAQMQNMQMEDAQRNRASQEAIGGALGDLDVMDDNQVRAKIGQLPPEARQGFAAYVMDQRKKRADIDKEQAAAGKTRTEGAKAQLELLGGLAGALAQKPDRNAWQASKAILQRVGLDPSALDVPEGVDPVAHWQQLAQGSLTRAQQMDAEDKRVGREQTARRDQATADNYLRVDSRSRDANAAQMANAAANRAQAAAFREAGMAQAAATREAAREAVQAGRIDRDTQALSKQIDANALPNLITSATALDNTLKKYAKARDIPGIGVVDANMPALMRSAEGNEIRSQVQGVANDLLKLYSGGAVTANEAERRATEMMASGQFGEEDLRRAWPLVKGRINAAVQNVRAGYSPEAVQTYEGRGGIKLKPVGGEPASRDALIKEAMDAMSKGAPRAKVLERLREMGITDAKI
jgi:hypothetical protein